MNMPYEHRDNTGSLIKNDRKERENHPDYKGSCKIAGVEYWMSAWIKREPGKETRMSFDFRPKEEQRNVAPTKAGEVVEQDVPF